MKATGWEEESGISKRIDEVLQLVGLRGTWVSIKVTGGDMNDKQVSWMVANRINVMVPVSDVMEVLAQ